ncbi:hypothetical protein V1511DRAFT_464465, partial [Dipodascopsis uninucleata]
DFASWAEVQGIPVEPFTRQAISLDQLLAVADYQGITFEKGDILLVRTGWMAKYNEMYEQGELDQIAGSPTPSLIGLDQSEEIKEWLHDQYFSVVGGDQPAFEAWPKKGDWHLHEYLLACWGVLIGEMLDLEELSKKCKLMNKYSFLFTSAPFNSPGGVASFANALAIL